jgi:hypothetical protein
MHYHRRIEKSSRITTLTNSDACIDLIYCGIDRPVADRRHSGLPGGFHHDVVDTSLVAPKYSVESNIANLVGVVRGRLWSCMRSIIAIATAPHMCDVKCVCHLRNRLLRRSPLINVRTSCRITHCSECLTPSVSLISVFLTEVVN